LSRASRASILALLVVLATGCWEQVSPEWFPQMKEQPSVQALENVPPLIPPAGTIPLGGMEPRIVHPAPAFSVQAMTLQSPVPPTPESIARGKYVYENTCIVCHGADGMANQQQVPVAKHMAANGMAPSPLIAAIAYTHGFLFTKIRYGKPGMPGYPQIPAEDRWHVVNYIKVLMMPKPVVQP